VSAMQLTHRIIQTACFTSSEARGEPDEPRFPPVVLDRTTGQVFPYILSSNPVQPPPDPSPSGPRIAKSRPMRTGPRDKLLSGLPETNIQAIHWSRIVTLIGHLRMLNACVRDQWARGFRRAQRPRSRLTMQGRPCQLPQSSGVPVVHWSRNLPPLIDREHARGWTRLPGSTNVIESDWE
jgi:hypothetical protein